MSELLPDKQPATLPALADVAVLRRLRKVLLRSGWDIEHVQIDLTAGQPHAVIKMVCNNGHWSRARVDSGTIQRAHRVTQMHGWLFGPPRSRIPRNLLRELARYVSETTGWSVSYEDMAALWNDQLEGHLCAQDMDARALREQAASEQAAAKLINHRHR